jgi:hypothetical protein
MDAEPLTSKRNHSVNSLNASAISILSDGAARQTERQGKREVFPRISSFLCLSASQ